MARDEKTGGPEAADAPRAESAQDAEAAERATARAEEAVEHDLDELTHVKRERDEYLELAQRTRADFDNYRKRVAKEAAEASQRGKAGLARELIPVLDNLQRALQAAGVENGPAGEAPSEVVPPQEALLRGVALVEAELRATLERAGVEAYDPTGESFDPSWHEALSTRPAEGAKPGTVIETLERGYRLDGQALRPARVVVAE